MVSDGDSSATAERDQGLDRLIRRDQLDAVRRSVLRAIVVNSILGMTCLAVAIRSGDGVAAGIWFCASSLVNLLRVYLCRAALAGLDEKRPASPEGHAAIDRSLRLSSLAALMSGIVWACVPFLCAGFTSPQTPFYLTIICGITAGAVTHGSTYARIPIAFIVPPLVSLAACLVAWGDFDRYCLAATVLLYLAVLARTCFEGEANFRRASSLKNEAKALADEMADRATRDALTGLLNRAGFTGQAAAVPASACLMLLDLDGFKSVNDIYGHKTGDRVLTEVGRRLRATTPASAIVGRLGGDEFAILYEPGDGIVAPGDLAQAIIAAIAAPFDRFDAGRLGISIGIHLGGGESLTERLVRADEALYAAKSAGRNRHRLFDRTLCARLDMRRDAERDLPQALAENAVEVWFQPIRRVHDQALAGVEALVRWKHPRHGWVPPPDLIAAAAMTGLAEPLLRYILEGVCRMRLALGQYGAEKVRVAMNVSPLELTQIPVDELVLATLATFGLPPCGLEIELTEETALDIAAVDGKLAALARAGVSIAVDDFGVGYSSLARLRQLHVSRVKIDRSLVTGLSGADDKRGLVQAVIGLGRALAVEVVAEGVESWADLVTLDELGCPFAQGYHLGRPMTHEALLETLPALVSRVA